MVWFFSCFPSSLGCRNRLFIWDLSTFSDIGIHCYKVPYYYYFCYTPWLHILYFQFHLSQEILIFHSWLLPWFIGCSTVSCLISMYFHGLQNFSCLWFLVLLHCGQKRHLFCGLSYCGMFLVLMKKKCVFNSCWIECSIDVYYIHLV